MRRRSFRQSSLSDRHFIFGANMHARASHGLNPLISMQICTLAAHVSRISLVVTGVSRPSFIAEVVDNGP